MARTFELLLSPMVCMGQLSNEHSILKDWSEVYVEIEDETQELTAGSASVLDSVTKGKILLKDGSQVYGEIVDMIEGLITLNTSFHEGEPIKIKWSEVTGIESQDVMTFVLSNGTTLQGQSAMIQPGTLGVQTDLKKEAILIPIASVQGVNPPNLKTFAYTGNLNFGASKATGNTNIQNYTFFGEFGARSERLRLSLLGRYVYGENDNTVTARHAFGTIKLDYFVTKGFFIDSGALFEQDTFQDLNFRTAAFAGPGYSLLIRKTFQDRI